MQKYKVKYRLHGRRFFKTLKNVVGDGMEGNFRFFALDDESLIHVPWDTEVRFSKERAVAIREKMSKQAGQPIV